MTLSNKQEAAFGEQLLEHPMLPRIMERVELKLFQRFVKSTHEERIIISSIIDAKALFLKELNIAVDEVKELSKREED